MFKLAKRLLIMIGIAEGYFTAHCNPYFPAMRDAFAAINAAKATEECTRIVHLANLHMNDYQSLGGTATKLSMEYKKAKENGLTSV